MGTNSSIEWTESTWNPVTGCTKISPGCKHCYAERMAKRLQAMGQPNYAKGSSSRCTSSLNCRSGGGSRRPFRQLDERPVPRRGAGRVHPARLRRNAAGRWHHFQVLTKRSERLPSCTALAVAAEHLDGRERRGPEYLHRIDHLRDTGAARVPLGRAAPRTAAWAGPAGIDWVIVGGESGPKARPMEAGVGDESATSAASAGVPFFFKQWGGVTKSAPAASWKAARGTSCRGRNLNSPEGSSHRCPLRFPSLGAFPTMNADC